MSIVTKDVLVRLYINELQSAADIAQRMGCSPNKVNYWLKKHNILKRSIADAIYVKNNPTGDPFAFQQPKDVHSALLYGLGLGLYWGEGAKRNKHTVKLGNTDPKLIKAFIRFLEKTYKIDTSKLRFGLQIFSDMRPTQALQFWIRELKVSKGQFQKVIVTPTRGIGTYRHKIQHGVLTVYFYNTKLRNNLIDTLEKL